MTIFQTIIQVKEQFSLKKKKIRMNFSINVVAQSKSPFKTPELLNLLSKRKAKLLIGCLFDGLELDTYFCLKLSTILKYKTRLLIKKTSCRAY